LPVAPNSRVDNVYGPTELLAEHHGDGPELVARYTGTPVPDRQLVAWLRDYLPIHRMPRRLHHCATLLLNVNGKIDRRALRAPG
jgi:hypothetical protein